MASYQLSSCAGSNGSYQPPPDDSKPTLLAALASVQTQATAVLATAADIERKTSTVIGDNPG